MWKEILEQPAVLTACRETNRPLIQKLADEIRSRGVQNILLAARGTSDHAALMQPIFTNCCWAYPSASQPLLSLPYTKRP